MHPHQFPYETQKKREEKFAFSSNKSKLKLNLEAKMHPCQFPTHLHNKIPIMTIQSLIFQEMTLLLWLFICYKQARGKGWNSRGGLIVLWWVPLPLPASLYGRMTTLSSWFSSLTCTSHDNIENNVENIVGWKRHFFYNIWIHLRRTCSYWQELKFQGGGS